jgi:hypothetical protein
MRSPNWRTGERRTGSGRGPDSCECQLAKLLTKSISENWPTFSPSILNKKLGRALRLGRRFSAKLSSKQAQSSNARVRLVKRTCSRSLTPSSVRRSGTSERRYCDRLPLSHGRFSAIKVPRLRKCVKQTSALRMAVIFNNRHSSRIWSARHHSDCPSWQIQAAEFLDRKGNLMLLPQPSDSGASEAASNTSGGTASKSQNVSRRPN